MTDQTTQCHAPASEKRDLERGPSHDTLNGQKERGGRAISKLKVSQTRPTQIEHRPSGYPQFAALIASDDAFHICRRFAYLRSRLLLSKQDVLSVLEKELEEVDQKEEIELRLSSGRIDNNPDRQVIMRKIDAALADYDQLVERNARMLAYNAAETRDTSSLQNWLDGHGSIARGEMEYLQQTNDLFDIKTHDDYAMSRLETVAEAGFVQLRKWFRTSSGTGVSSDPHVHVFPQSRISFAARILITPAIIILLLTPVIVCSVVDSLAARLAVIIASTSGFITVLAAVKAGRSVELMVAATTYATVLVVFITGPTT